MGAVRNDYECGSRRLRECVDCGAGHCSRGLSDREQMDWLRATKLTQIVHGGRHRLVRVGGGDGSTQDPGRVCGADRRPLDASAFTQTAKPPSRSRYAAES